MKYLLLITILFISSCGQDYLGNKDTNLITVGEQMNLSSGVTSKDEANARLICNSFRSKRLKVITSESLMSAEYDLKSSTCDGAISNSKASVKFLVSLSMDNLTSTAPFENYLQTDERGPLKDICSSIYKGENFTLISYTDASNVKQILFSSDRDFHILYGVKKGINYNLNQKISYSISNDSQDINYGHVLKYKEESACANSSSSFIREQTIL